MNKFLILFTSEYPYGYGETYIENEIAYLASAFEKILIISNARSLSHCRAIPDNVSVLVRDYKLTKLDKFLSLRYIFSSCFWEELQFLSSVYGLNLSRVIFNTILQTIYKSHLLEKFIRENVGNEFKLTEAVFYSYWADDNAASLALMKARGCSFKAVCRAHRWDVYFEKNLAGYLPFRKTMAEKMDAYLFISENGLNYFKEKTKSNSTNLGVFRLGVCPFLIRLTESKTNEFHILSCSSVIARKRVDKIVSALAQIKSTIKIRWTHIGGGELLESLADICSRLLNSKSNISFHLAGNLTNEEVKLFYSANHIDLFINVSDSEGVPVAIMEALSAGVPAIATDVEGNSEVVINNYNGILIEKDFDTSVLAKILENYIEKPIAEKLKFRENSKSHYLRFYSAEKNYSAFAKFLTEI